MQQPTAIIRQVRLEVSCADAQHGPRLPERLSHLFGAALERVLAEELVRYGAAGANLRLPQLTLVLSPVAQARLEQDLPALLRTALREALARLPSLAPPVATPWERGLTSIEHFLRWGMLPWQVAGPGFNLDQALGQAMTRQPGALHDLLRRLGELALTRQRLVRQLSLVMLEQLLTFLEPVHAPLVRAYLADTLAAHHHRPLVPASEPALRQVLYELMLADLLKNHQTHFNRRAFVERQLRQLAAHYNLDFAALLRQLVLALPTQPQLAVTLPAILQALSQQVDALPSGLPDSAGTEPAARPTTSAAATQQLAVLRYFLRHGSLPPTGQAELSPAALAAALAMVLRQGQQALRQLAREAGATATAQALVRYLPQAAQQQLLQVLVPGRVRPVLALLEAMAKRTNLVGVNREQHWVAALTYLLAEERPSSRLLGSRPDRRATGYDARQGNAPLSGYAKETETAITIGLARWLATQADVQVKQPAVTAREQLLDYLRFGRLDYPVADFLALNQLRGELRVFLAEDADAVRGLLNEHWAGRPVLRSLATLADAALLAHLLPVHSRGRNSAALAVLLTGGHSPAPATRSHWLREAYLLFRLWAGQRRGAPSLAAARQLTAAYHLPARALYTWLSWQLRQVPTLAQEPFVRWLLAALALTELVANRRATASRVAHSPLLIVESETATPAIMLRAVRWPEQPTATASGPALARLEAFQKQLRDRNGLSWLQTVVSSQGAEVGFRPSQVSYRGEAQRGGIVITAAKAERPALVGKQLVRVSDSRLPTELRLLGSRPTAAPVPGQYRLAGMATVAEAREMLFAYLRRGFAGPPLALLRLAWRWVAGTHPKAIKTFLRQYGTVAGVLPRAAALTDVAALAMLLPTTAGRGGTSQAASWQTLAVSLGDSSRLLFFLKSAYLHFHCQPATGFASTVRQQLVAIGLPQRATLTRLFRLGERQLAGIGTTFFQRLLAALQMPAVEAAADRSHVGAGETGRLLALPTPVRGSNHLLKYEAAATDSAAALAPEPALPGVVSQPVLDLLLHYLRYGKAPWWRPALPSRAELARTLRQAARRPQPVREFLRRHAAEPAVRQHLVQLADFSLLHQLVPPPGASHGRQLVRPALAALDRTLRQPASLAQPRFQLFLREAYLAFATANVATDPLAVARPLVQAHGLTWRSVVARASQLLRTHPALAADPFFRALLRAATAQYAPARTHLRRSRLAPPVPAVAIWPGEAAAPSPARAAAWQVLEHYLQTGQPPLAGNPAAVLPELLAAASPVTAQLLRPYLGSPTARTRLAALLSPTWFFRLLRWLLPVAHAELVGPVRDWQQLLARNLVQAGAASQSAFWAEALAVAQVAGPPGTRLAALARWLLQAASNGQPLRDTLRQLLRGINQQRLKLRSPLVALLVAQALGPPARRGAATPGVRPAGPATPTSLRPRPSPAAPAAAETAYVVNAGLVLLWPFFTMLFERLGYLAERQFKDEAAADRAIHLLQFLVTGEQDSPEYLLVLNKLLCGVAAGHPLPRALPLTPAETSTGEDLLRAVLGRWEVLKNTSIAGLRETFLQRPGKLDYHPDRVTLTVETKTVDILLDQRPWSIALIKLPWMPLPLHVTWR